MEEIQINSEPTKLDRRKEIRELEAENAPLRAAPQVCIAEIVTIDAAMAQGEQK